MKIFKAIFLAFAGNLATIGGVQANETQRITYDQAPGYIRFAELNVNDGVTDGCWTNAGLVKSKLKLLLEQNEVHVVESVAYRDFTRPNITVGAYGGRSNGVCIVSINFEVATWASMTAGGSDGADAWLVRGYNVMFSKEAINSGSNLNGWISDHVEESASEFLAKVISGRRDPNVEMYFRQYPYKLEVPMTQKEYEAEVEKQKSE